MIDRENDVLAQWEVLLLWAAAVVFCLTVWAYALVGFWYVNQDWLHSLWRWIEQ